MPSTASPLSRRRRRLRTTALLLSLAGAAGLLAGAIAYFVTRPPPYQPGESDPDVTSELSRALPADAPKPRLTDVTAHAGLASFRTFVGDRTSQIIEDMGPGAAWGDFDNDGDDDLFLVSAGGSTKLPPEQWSACELHENLGDGTFRKVTRFPEVRIQGMAAAWGDYDSDGWLDLIVTGYNALFLFHNVSAGPGRAFEREARFPDLKGFWAGAAWGDFNNDRHLDLYICGYIQYVPSASEQPRESQQLGLQVPYTLNPASYTPEHNLLFQNNGDGTFTEVAKQLKVSNPEGRSLGALWHDFDDDGWLDLYVANDISDNVFYHNQRGAFVDVSHRAWVADYRSAMGLAAGDWNRDGDDDLFISHWVAQENALYDNLLADFNSRFATNQHAPTPSSGTAATSLYPLRFMDIADMKGLGQIALPCVGWGAEFVDLDADGWLDLIVANGNTLETDTTPKRLKPQQPFLFWNRRGEHFYDLAPGNAVLREAHVGRGLALSDFDNDGDVDVLLSHLGEGVQLLRNEMQTGHWLKVRLRSRSARGENSGFGDGAKLIAHVEGGPLRRTVSSASYLSQSSRVLHFGLGAATAVPKLEVRWLGGQTNVFTNLSADTTWEITEGQGEAKPLGPARAPPASATHQPTARNSGATAVQSRSAVIEFWKAQRAAMDALKLEKNCAKAIPLFRQALALNPQHEDSRYYLSYCLATEGNVTEALAQLEELVRLNPHSQRGFQQWGNLRALFASNNDDLEAAQKAIERAREINPEETGALLLLGEIALLQGDAEAAERHLAAACQTNPRAVAGFFLRGYLAWKGGDTARARAWLEETRKALGKEWRPRGATSEGDVQRKQHVENTPLSRFWESWNGEIDPDNAFSALNAFLMEAPQNRRPSG